MEDFQFQFEKLNAWQEARKLVVNVYRLMEKFQKPRTMRFATSCAEQQSLYPPTLLRARGGWRLRNKFIFLKLHLVR